MRLHPFLRPLVSGAGRIFKLWLRSLAVTCVLPDGSVTSLDRLRHDDAIFAFSERDLLAVIAAATLRPFIVLIDESRDGDWAEALIRPMRCTVVRGSSLHDGLCALRALTRRLAESGDPAAIVVDGPVGPAGEAKPGVAFSAAYSGRAIVPAAAAVRRGIVFSRSWAAHALPLPFTAVRIAIGEPIRVRPNRGDIDRATAAVTDALATLPGVAAGASRAGGRRRPPLHGVTTP